MAGDEALALHERLEAATGVDWQLLYLPIVLAGAAGSLAVLRRERSELARWVPWVGGAAAWGVAQAREFAEFDSADVPRNGYGLMVVAEELLEMTGSLLWVVAFAVILSAPVLRGRHPAEGAGSV
jgi:hypothetical protein